jgi:molybdenum cofactor cytidylyltransferase
MQFGVRRDRVFAVVLAAGQSSRFGSPKQLAGIDGESMVARVTSVAVEVCGAQTLVLAGSCWQNIVERTVPRCPFFAINDRYRFGIATSIALATKLLADKADAIVLLLADQPLVTADHLHDLINRWSRDENEIVASAYAGTKGPPVLLPRGAFHKLSQLTGDTGARTLFSDSQFRTVALPCGPAAVDIDTVDDLKKIR